MMRRNNAMRGCHVDRLKGVLFGRSEVEEGRIECR